MTDLNQLERDLLARIEAAGDERALEDARVAALGKKGAIPELLKTLGSLAPEERKEKGAAFNQLRDRIAGSIAARKAALDSAALNAKLSSERVDVTLPPPDVASGTVHPVSQVMAEIIAIF